MLSLVVVMVVAAMVFVKVLGPGAARGRAKCAMDRCRNCLVPSESGAAAG